MLACRPMLSLALAAIAGVLTMRMYPELAYVLPYGWFFFLGLSAWFLLRPGAALPAVPDTLPDAYVRHIMLRPGFLARRGLNRFILLLCLACLLAAMQRQGEWREHMDVGSLPENRYFSAVLLMDAPSRRHADENGRIKVPARLLLANGHDAGKVRVQFYSTPGGTFRRGDVVRARVRLSIPRVKSHPGAFDRRFWLERDGLAASVNAIRTRKIDRHAYPYSVLAVDAPPTYVRLLRVIDGIRARAIGATLDHGGAHGPMLAAMLYGYRDDMDRELNAAFRRVGIGHVLAISGLHVGLVVGMLWWMLGHFSLPVRWRAMACLALALLYLGLSGGQVAAARATLMAVIHLAGVVWGRKSDMLNSLGAAAFVIVIANPTAPIDISFQLSFTAVIFIYIGVRGWQGRRERHITELPHGLDKRAVFLFNLRKRVDSLVRLSIATWLGLYPIIAMAFNQVNLVGLPINVFVIPWMGVVLACGLLLPVLGWIPGVGRLLTFPSEVLVWTATFSDALPLSSFPVHAPNGWWVAGFFASIFLFMLHGMIAADGVRRRWLLFCVAGSLVTLAGVSVSMLSLPPPAGGRIALLSGSGVGVVAAEAPGGGMALVGQFRGGGADEASWLHSVRRAGTVAVVEAGKRGKERFGTLAYHYTIASFANIAVTEAKADGREPVWLPVREAAGVEYAVLRNGKGRLFALAVRSGGKMLCSVARAAAEDVDALCSFVGGEAETGADIFVCLGYFERKLDLGELRNLSPGIRIGYKGVLPDAPPEWFAMNEFGSVVLGETLSAYDGADWREVATRRPAGADGCGGGQP